MSLEKNAGAEHQEEVDSSSQDHKGIGRPDSQGFVTDGSNLPKGYFYSLPFLGTMTATGFGLIAAVGGFGLAAPNLTLINNDIGPDPNIVWVSLVYTLTMAIGLLLVGRLSDLFGRRWFFISTAMLALIGCIVCATAQSVGTLIAGTTLIGIAASGQQSFAFITGEIVPMKHRFSANALMYLFLLPTSMLGPAVSKAFIVGTAAGWRWCYYFMIIINAVSGILFYFCYHPPTFHEKYENRTVMQQLKDFDWIGTVLFIAGFVIFLLGLSWGGTVYPWKSAHVISTMVVGGLVIVAFALWELYADLKEPLLPMHLFRNFSWVAACILLGLGASIYYAMAIMWPSMVAVLYTDDGGASMYAGWLSCVSTAGINWGMIIGGFLAEPIGKTKYQCVSMFTIGGILFGCLALAGPDTKGLAIGLMFFGSFLIGWNETVTLSLAGIELLDQREIGTAIGAAGSIRSAISSVANAVYLSVLNNRMAQTIPAQVPTAAIEAGLPPASVPSLLQGLSTGSFSGVGGLTDEILAISTRAYQEASSDAYRTVFFTTIAFSVIAIGLSFFCPNVDDKMTDQIAVTLHNTGAPKTGVEEKV